MRTILPMRLCSLASSSKAGSSYLIEGEDGTRVLVDCGLGIRRLEARLWEAGVNPDTLSGVFVSHDHSDHTTALRLKNPFTAKHQVPLFGSPSLLQSLGLAGSTRRLGECHPVSSGRPVRVGGLEVMPFRKSHDAPEPLGFLLSDGSSRAAVATDLGTVTQDLIDIIQGATYLVFESNHDVDMEVRSGRPVHLIRRVLSDHGHLSNEQAGAALARIAGRETKMILLAHLSDECNTPELAFTTVSRHLDQAGYAGGLGVAPMFERSCLFSEEHCPRLADESFDDLFAATQAGAQPD